MRKKIQFSVIALLLLLSTACRKTTPIDERGAPHPVPIASFIQSHLVFNWTDAEWEKEYAALQEAGMKYLILQQTVDVVDDHQIYAIYPSALPHVQSRYGNDLVEACLRNAEKYGFKVFLGLNFSNKWWHVTPASKGWFAQQMMFGNEIADELMNKYKSRYSETMYGWYWVWEIANVQGSHTPEFREMIIELLNINLDHLTQRTPHMPVLISPFMNQRLGTAEEYATTWTEIFKKAHFKAGDIFAPQDCIGSGHLTLDVLDHWFSALGEAVKTKPGLLFWANTELFDERFWSAASADRIVNQMQKVERHVSNYISFAYSHYYSPNQKRQNQHETYVYYVKKGRLPMSDNPPPVVSLRVVSSNGLYFLTWDEPVDKHHVMGYKVIVNDVPIADVQYNKYNQCETKIQITDLKQRYDVVSYNFCGVYSKAVTPQ